MSTETKKTRRGRFWLFYGIFTALALIGIVVGLFVFRGYIAAYEDSQPIHTAEIYAASLTGTDWETLLQDAVTETSGPYESDDAVLDACREKLRFDEISVRKSAGGNADSPVFTLMCKDVAFGTLTLKTDDTDRFGFPVWTVASIAVIPDALVPADCAVVIRAPKESVVTLNGITLGKNELVSGDTPYPYFTEFDAGIAGTFCCTYSVSGLHTAPDVRCRLGDAECPLSTDGREGEMQFLLPDYHTAAVVVPNGTEVRVNGIALDDRYRTEAPTPYTEANGSAYEVYEALEKGAEGLPYREYYAVHDLLAQPTVTAFRGGVQLPLEESNGTYQADYPEEELYRCEISVPVGSTVTMRGQDCACYRQPETESRFIDLYDDPKQAPQWEKYVIERLFLEPETPLVTYHGYSLPTERTEEGRVVSFSSVLPQIDNADVISLAKEFVHAYFTYTSWGFYETQAHLQAVLAMTAPGSQLSAKLRRSLDSFSYVTPVTAEQRDLTAEIVYEPEPGAFIVPITFQVRQEIYSVRRAFSGTITLLIRTYGNAYAVYGMVIENDP